MSLQILRRSESDSDTQNAVFLAERESSGLHSVAKSRDTSSTALDIVAVNGLTGHWKSSWTDRKSNFFWLGVSLPQQFPSANIYSYGPNYETDSEPQALIWALVDERTLQHRENVPIMFIGHSMGGTIVKQVFIETSATRTSLDVLKRLHSSISAVAFLGTRHRGDFDESLRLSKLFFAVTSTVGRDTKVFWDSKACTRSEHEFRLLNGESLPILNFYETIPTAPFGKVTVSKDDATIKGNSNLCEDRPMAVTHSDLGRFNSAEDRRLTAMLSSLERLSKKASMLPINETRIDEVSSRHHQPGQEQQARLRKRRILSLDGGGIRGIFSVIVLESLMEEIRLLLDARHDIKPCDYFDLIGGTSTGGLLAVMLGRLCMDIASCKKEYKQMAKRIFQKSWAKSVPGRSWFDAYWGSSWYASEPLEKAIKEITAERLSMTERKELRAARIKPEDAPLRSAYLSKARCFVVAIKQGQRGCVRLRSYQSKGGQDEEEAKQTLAIWQACRATSAAQIYFPPITIGDTKYWDGGSDANNPIQETYIEACIEFGNLQTGVAPPLSAIISIGTGMPTHHDPGEHAVEVIDSFKNRATDTETKHLKFKESQPQLEPFYFRFQGSTELGSIDLASWSQIEKVEQIAEEFVVSLEGQELIKKCARQLVSSGGVDTAQKDSES